MGLNQTGYKGIGFKASFVLSKKPHVLSTYQPPGARGFCSISGGRIVASAVSSQQLDSTKTSLVFRHPNQLLEASWS